MRYVTVFKYFNSYATVKMSKTNRTLRQLSCFIISASLPRHCSCGMMAIGWTPWGAGLESCQHSC